MKKWITAKTPRIALGQIWLGVVFLLGSIGCFLLLYAEENVEERIQKLFQERKFKELEKIGKPAVPALIEALKNEDSEVRWEAAIVLRKAGDKSAVPALTEALKDKDSEVRRKAAYALGWIGDKSAIPALTEALKDKDSLVRMYATQALRTIRDFR